MKKLVLWAMLMHALFTSNATTFNILRSASQPPVLPALGGAIVPMLQVEALATDKLFPPPLYLAVQVTGNTRWENPIESLFIGDEFGLVSWGPFYPPANGPFLVGPIFLQEGVVRPVIISALFRNDLTDADGKIVGLEVVGASADGYMTEIGDRVVFESGFPILGNFYPVNKNGSVASVQIQNTTKWQVIEPGRDQIRFGTFEVNVENEDIIIPGLDISVYLSTGDVTNLTSVIVIDDSGTVIGPLTPFLDEKGNSASFYTHTPIRVSEGKHTFMVLGTVSDGLTEATELWLNWNWFGEFRDDRGYGILPELVSDDNQGIVLTTKKFVFNYYMQVGSTGYDVFMLQRLLGVEHETRPEEEGPFAINFFGPLTKAAVEKFQLQNGLPSTGFVGPLTLAVLNSFDLESIAWPEKVAIKRTPITGLTYVILSITGRPNVKYRLESSNDLNYWTTLRELELGDSGEYGFKADFEENRQQFYRIKRMP